MTWFKVDDSLDFHPKVEAAGNAAMGLWVRAGAYSSRMLSEGFVAAAMVPKLGGRPKDAHRLVEVGLWLQVPGGYQFHEWEQANPSKEKVLAERAAAAERQRRARDKAAERKSQSESRRDATDASRRDFGVSHAPPDPTRPDQEEKKPPPAPRVPPQPSASRGTTIPTDFEATPDLIAWARTNTPDVPASEHGAFLDYWRAATGAKALKRDWPATWRTWMRRAQADIAAGRRPSAKRSTTDERVAQARSLRAHAEALDAADQATLTLVPALEGAS